MLRNLYLLFVSLFALSATKAQQNNDPFILQPYLGIATPVHSGARGIGLQGGVKYTPNTAIPVYLGFDEIMLSSNVKNNWPDVGTYRYHVTTNFFSLNLGFHALKDKRISLDAGLSCEFLHTKGRLETDNASLKDFLLDRYEHENTTLAGFMHINGQINHALSAFLRVTFHVKQYTNNQWVVGCGLAYNIYNIAP